MISKYYFYLKISDNKNFKIQIDIFFCLSRYYFNPSFIITTVQNLLIILSICLRPALQAKAQADLSFAHHAKKVKARAKIHLKCC